MSDPVPLPLARPLPWLPGLGRISAGAPLEAVAEGQREDLLGLLAAPGRYALRVSSDALCDNGILAGDFVIVQSQQQAADGDLVVAVVDGDQVALHRIRHLPGGRILLRADNPAQGDRALAGSRVAIQGKVVGQLRRYR